MNRRNVIVALFFATGIGLGSAVHAQSYPARPVRLIVPFAAGGSADLLARLVGQRLTQTLGQSFVVENRPGAGATLGSKTVAIASPDGYTLLESNAASQGTAPAMGPVPYDSVADFTHICLIGTIAQYLVVNPAVPAKTLAEFVAYAQANPGKLNLGTAGNGSIGHFAGAMFMSRTKLNLVVVPYKGTAPATQDLIAGRVQAVFQNAPEAAPLIKAGQVRLLAVTGEHREPDFPQAPTFQEAGYPGFVNYTWYGISGPRDMPTAVATKLNAAIRSILAEPAMREKLRSLGVTSGQTSGVQYTDFVRTEVSKFRRLAEENGISQ
jgi:tripartite-type tricarboxylate transporter receptor subunit TctC